MNRVLGFLLFWTGIGMMLMIIIPTNFWTVLAAGCHFMLIGYNLFCSS